MREMFVRWRGGRAVGILCLRLLRGSDDGLMRPWANIIGANECELSGPICIEWSVCTVRSREVRFGYLGIRRLDWD